MRRRNARYAATLLLLTLLTASASAQEAASIIGQVTDESGATLPGVTVTATSPALQVPSVVGVTDERGEYRITPLPIGVYTVEYTLSGFQTVRNEGVRLTVGFSARLDVGLKVGGIAETITVSGLAPVVDPTATSAATTFTQETLSTLPTGRIGAVSILQQAPGVRGVRDVGGSGIGSVPSARMFGQNAELYYTLEGVQTSALQPYASNANFWDYSSIEEAQVGTIAHGAETPYRGVNLNAIVKSGGNAFHGSFWVNKTSATLQSNNIDEKLAAAGITGGGRLVQRDSYTGDLGGRIVRDKLWFYGAFRKNTNYHEELNVFKPDGTPVVSDEFMKSHTEKVSYQLSGSQKLIGFYQLGLRYSPSASQFRPYEHRVGLTTPTHTYKAEYQSVHSSTLVTSLQYGRYYVRNFRWSFSPPGMPPTFDQVTQIETGPRRTLGVDGNSGQSATGPRHHWKGTTTWFRPDLFKGNHEFKLGFDYVDSWFGRQQLALPPDLMYRGAYRANPYNYRLRFDNGTPFQIEVGNNPVAAKVITHYLGLYLQDSWTIARRVTLNLGVRYAHDNGFVPASCFEAQPPGHVAFPATCYEKKQFNVWNPIAPRLHASWDIAGNGKTMLKGGWGRFPHARQHDPEMTAADPQVPTTVTYRWRDLNGNRDYDPGEVNLDPINGGDFVSQSAGTNTVPNPNEREPISNEFSLSFERELIQDFAFRATGIYSRYSDVYRLENELRPYESYNVRVTNPDPGPDGRLNTADDPGTFVTYYEYPTALRGRSFERFRLTNDANLVQDYKTLDFALTKRLSNRWQMLVSYSITRANNPLDDTTDASSPNSNVMSGDRNPNAEINTSLNFLDWVAKVNGVYVLPHDISLSGQVLVDSGTPYARQVLFRGGVTIPSITLNVEPMDARRLPNVTQVDLRAEKSFTIRSTHKLAVRMNVFNALNTNAVLNVVKLSGPNFLLPTSVMPPRIAEFGVSYTF